MEHLQTTETCHRIFVPYNIQLQNLPMWNISRSSLCKERPQKWFPMLSGTNSTPRAAFVLLP